MAVSFDGTAKRMVVAGVVKVDVQRDLYSAWKHWLILSDNAKYEQALRPVGGDGIGGGQQSPVYFFLMNDWKVVVDAINVDFALNLYCEEATNSTTFPFIVQNNGTVSYKVSDSPVVTTAGGSGLSAEQATQLEAAATESVAARKMVKNDAVTSADSKTSTIFDDDGVTPYHVFNHPNSKERRES
jgi:hypothetical protein